MRTPIFLFIAFCSFGYSQTQTFMGVKTFSSPPKFLNLVAGNSNTKVLTINGANVLQYRDVSTFTSPVLEAPINGQNYVRNNGSWALFTPSAGGNFQSTLDLGNTANKGFSIAAPTSGSTPVISVTTGDYRSAFTTSSSNGTFNIYPLGILMQGSANEQLFSIFKTGSNSANVTVGGTGNSSVQIGSGGGVPSIILRNGLLGNGSKEVQIDNNQLVFRDTGISYAIRPELPMNYNGGNNVSYIPAAFGKFGIVNTNAPSSSTDTGVVGEIRVTATYIYTCIAPNSWVRAATATW